MSTTPGRQPATVPRGNLVRWGAVFAGTIVGTALFALFTTLWLALGYDSNIAWWRDSLNWWIGATGIGAALAAGAVAGYLSGARGLGAGLANSATVWGLVTLAAVFGGIPIGLGYFGATDWNLVTLPSSSLWTTFWTLVIGLAAAMLGGALGGAVSRPAPITVGGGADDPRIGSVPPGADEFTDHGRATGFRGAGSASRR